MPISHRWQQELGVGWATKWHTKRVVTLATPTFFGAYKQRILGIPLEPRTRPSRTRQSTKRQNETVSC